ncbi:MAG TPA: HAMP domain-containing protein [Thermoanaerobaculia bacterium]
MPPTSSADLLPLRLFAMAAGALLGRRLAAPLAAMRGAALRIGAGDLTTPVAPADGAEMSALTSTLDDMRQRLRSLTGELRQREAEAHAILSGVVEGVFAAQDAALAAARLHRPAPRRPRHAGDGGRGRRTHRRRGLVPGRRPFHPHAAGDGGGGMKVARAGHPAKMPDRQS